jgi:quercetin dioxygenase-like cupin family protein
MIKKTVTLDRLNSRVSRRVVVQMAPVLPVIVGAGGVAYAEGGYEQAGAKMTQLLRNDLEGQGNKVQESIVTRVEFPPGQGAPLHFHPWAQEILFVLEGNLSVQVEGQGAKVVKVGEVALTPADVPHSVRNDGQSTTAKVLVVHSRADKQKPLLVLTKPSP